MTVAPEDAEIYGEELVNDARRWAREEFAPHLQQLEHRIDQFARGSNQAMVIAALDRDPSLGNWRNVNEDPEFLRWLNEIDELNGVPRQQLLTRAFNLGASDRVAHIFRAFLASRLPQRERTDQRLPFETSPRAPAPQAGAHPNGRRIYSRADIRKFYEDKRLGRYDGREPEALRVEADIIAAGREGRIAADAVQMRSAHPGEFGRR